MIETWSDTDAAAWLRVPDQADDKYRRGVLCVRTGSRRYPGAAVLGISAAWRTGVGMLRYLPPHEDAPAGIFASLGIPPPAAAVLAAHPETVIEEWPRADVLAGPRSDANSDLERPDLAWPDLPRGDAWLLGSGTDASERTAAEEVALSRLAHGAVPLVVDAGALDLALRTRALRTTVNQPRLAAADRDRDDMHPTGTTESHVSLTTPAQAPATSAEAPLATPAGPMIITPHRGEFRRMWPADALGDLPWPTRRRESAVPAPAFLAEAALELAAYLRVTVLLKGSTSIVATPGGSAIAVGPATPWLAAAGTGDVLAGILGALVASHAELVRDDPELLGPLGASAALIHDRAARAAADDPRGLGGGQPITAGDVAAAIPGTFARLRG